MKSFNVPTTYRSPLISAIKMKRKQDDKLKKDFTPTCLDFGNMKIFLARHFGFCYGVEHAIEIAFKTIEENPGKNIFLLSEMIHNPFVNQDLMQKGVRFLMDTKGNQIIPFETLTKDDIVLIPAFGTTIDIEKELRAIGIAIEKYDTTCPFVEKVWNRAEQIAERGYSIVIHGKPIHEETRATFSHSAVHAPSVVVNDLNETIELAKYITSQKPSAQFYEEFRGRFSEDFDITKDLTKLGVVNQTTMLAADTQEIADYLKQVMIQHFNLNETNIADHFADTRDTLCYATNDNQTAVSGMLQQKADFAIVVGGRNSSNTSHLVELCEHKLPTFFIRSEHDILDADSLLHYNWITKEESIIQNWKGTSIPTQILITSGASCPDAIVEAVIKKLHGIYNCSTELDAIIQKWI